MIEVKKVESCPECGGDCGLDGIWSGDFGFIMGGFYNCLGCRVIFPMIGQVKAEELEDDTIILPDRYILV